MTPPIETATVESPSRGREFVRSFLFAVKIDSPLARLHVGTKLLAILGLSIIVVRFIRTEDPDPVGAILMILLAFTGLYSSGLLRWVFRSYLLVLFPALLGMALTWVIFNPDPGQGVLTSIPVYSGQLKLGLSLAWGVFIACVVVWYIYHRELFWGIVGGLTLAAIVSHLTGNPGLALAEVDLFQPFTIIVSARNVAIAITKSLGYGAMIFVSLILLMTTRDIEFTGLMMQLRIPYVASFFVSTMLRSLNLALVDYSTIRQAQIARGASLEKKSLLQTIRDLAYMAVPLTATMLRRSSEIGDAILIRGFTMQTKNPTEFHEIRPFTWRDWIVLGICILLVFFVFVFGVNFTRLLGVTL